MRDIQNEKNPIDPVGRWMKELGITIEEELDEAMRWHFMSTRSKLDNLNIRLKKIEKVLGEKLD